MLSAFKDYLKRPDLWRYNCESVARGVAIGLFTAFIPIFPFQMLLAVILAIMLRANISMAVLLSWVSNPLTLVPLTYFTYYIGNLILGENSTDIVIQHYTSPFNSLHDFWAATHDWILEVGKAFLIGMPILALSAALGGYLCVIFFCKIRTHLRAKQQKK